MAIYTFTSGIESQAVGQYSNFTLSSLANRTIGSFTLRTARGLFGFITSDERRTYSYHPAVIDRYTEIDFGSILYTPQPVTTTQTILPDEILNSPYDGVLSNTLLSNSGTGTGSTGGFNIGRHIRFNSTSAPRYIQFSVPDDIQSELSIEVIRGTDSNGGEDPDTTSENLNLQYSTDGITWNFISTVVAYNDTSFNTLNTVTIPIPSAARAAGTQFRIIQTNHSGFNWDHYGVTSVTYDYQYTPVIPSNDYGSITDATATQVDHGRIYYVTNVESFGFVKVVSEASWKATNSYEGTGTAFTFGKQTAPARYGYISDGKVRCSGTADSAFSPATESRGGLSLRGNTAVGISIGNIIFGKIFSGGITSYATTDVYLSEDLKTLFTTTGAATDIHTRAYEASGTLFNFSGVIEKSVYDYVGSGRLFGFNNLEEARTYDYNPGSINFFYKEDYGFIPTCNSSEDISGVVSGDAASCEVRVIDGSTAIVDLGQVYRPAPLDNLPTAFLDYGFVSETANLEIDYGYITITSDLNPFGLFDIADTGDIAFVPNWVSYGQIKFTGAAFLPIDANIIGTGSIPTLGGAAEVIAVSEESTDLFRFSGDGQIGITVQHFGSGTIFGISGAAEAVAFNPEEEQMLFSFTGELAENITKSHIGEGVLFTLQTAVEKTVYDYVGSGTLFTLNSLEERRAYDYNCSSVVVFEDLDYGLIVDRGNLSVTQIGTTTISTPTTGPSGAIQIAVGATVTITPTGSYTVPNQLSTPQYFEDYGLVSEIYDPTRDYGWILGTVAQGQPGCIYGEIDVFGVADIQFVPSFIGSGVIELDGEAYVPLDAKQIGSGTIFSISGAAEAVAYAEETKELFKILGTGQIGITVQHFGSGTLFGISGVTEAVAFNPVDITTDIKITGTSGDPTLVYAHLATGTLFNFSGAVEKAVYDYVGDGEINLVARKPEIYELSELANFTLDQYQIASNYIDLGDTSFYTGHTQLGPVELKWIEAEEASRKHTEVYDLNLCDDPEEIDYGLLVNRAPACVPVNGVVGTSTTSSTGCTVIPPGTSLIVPPGVTYTIQPQLLSATDFEDYGHIFGMPSPYRDYGHILEGTGFSCPFGSLGTFNGELVRALLPQRR